MGILSEVGSRVLLFMLIFGMSATVDINNLRRQLRNRNAIITGKVIDVFLCLYQIMYKYRCVEGYIVACLWYISYR